MKTPRHLPRPARMTRHLLAALLLAAVGTAGHAQGNSKAAKFYEDALVRYEKKDVEGAIIQLKNALQADPNMLPVQLLLGKALMQNGEVAAAEVAYNEALRLGVNRAEVVIPLGQAYLAQGKHKQLLEERGFNLAGLPAGIQLQLNLLRASAYADLGDARNALRSIDEARAIDARVADVWFAEIPVRIRTREFREANAAADKGLALAPASAEGQYQKGAIAHAVGDLRGALAAYDRAIASSAGHVEARVARAGIYMDLGRFPEALKDVTELQRLSPQEPRGAYLRALLAERDGNAAASKAALKEVTELLDPVPPDFIRFRPQLLMLNGLAHFGLNEREKAKQYLELFQRVQNNSPASKLLARIYMGENNAALAISVLEAYLKAQPGDGQAMTLLASAHIAQGRPAKATALMQEALRAQDNPAYRTVLGMGLLSSGQTASGKAELEASYKKDAQQTQAATSLIALYLRGGEARKAVPIAEGLVKQQPSNAGYHNLLGMAQGQSGNIAASRAAFEKALQLDDNFSQAKLNLARVDIGTKAYDAAAKRLNELLKLEPRNSEAMAELATLADLQGKTEDAQRWLEKARDAAPPKDTHWALALVNYHLRYGKAGPALDAAKVASGKAPEDLATLLAYSRALLANGDTVGAKNTLTNATRFADYNAPQQTEIATLQIRANNPAGAAYSLEKALTGQPDYLPAQALMAEVDVRLGDTAKAEKRARDIVTQNPRLAIGYSLLGDIAMAKTQPAAAVDSYRRAHQIDPSPDTLLRLFRATVNQDGSAAALQLAEQWLRSRPQDVMVRKLLADGQARAGNFNAAKLSYQAALKVRPDDAEALNNLANVQLRLKDPDAIKTAELALTKMPGNATVIDTLGWALHLNGKTDRALPLLRDARLRQPGSAEIRYHLAVVLAQTGRRTEAHDELDAALKMGTGFEGRAEAEKLLQTLK